MRMSVLFAPTLKEAPGEAKAPSHQLLLRAAFVRQVVAGVYTFLPLGLRTLRKIEDIVREEMDAAGAQEVRMPAIVPSEPWKVTGRWQAYGDDMFKVRDRHDREMGLGPTHEEVVTPMFAAETESYRDLPRNLYQIQWKYRDEPRPRSGLIRAREFLMKDAYSFDRDEHALKASYDAMVHAYERIMTRCGLDYRKVEADPGLIGGDASHEFMAPAAVGEDLFVHCDSCDFAANVEAAPIGEPDPPAPEDAAALEVVHTPDRPTIRDVARFLGVGEERLLKTMVYEVDGEPILVLVPGDRDVSESKLSKALAPSDVRPLDDAGFARAGLAKGYVGPQGNDALQVVADHRVRGRANWVAGANRADHHATGVNEGRDFTVDRYADVAVVEDGDRCPRCSGRLVVGRGIEVGHCFQLGTRYSAPLKTTFVDEDGTERPFVMGCYGIGLSRIVASVAEQHNDERGLLWPRAVAPYDAVVVCANMDQPEVVAAAERVYDAAIAAGIETLLDDRRVSAGVKFADADLIGLPVQVVVGKRGVARGVVEVRARRGGDTLEPALDDAATAVADVVRAAP